MYYTMTSTDPARKSSITTTRQIFCPTHFREVGLASLVPTLAAMGVDFLNKMMQHDPSRRIIAQRALEH
jgi:hypothetical protein